MHIQNGWRKKNGLISVYELAERIRESFAGIQNYESALYCYSTCLDYMCVLCAVLSSWVIFFPYAFLVGEISYYLYKCKVLFTTHVRCLDKANFSSVNERIGVHLKRQSTRLLAMFYLIWIIAAFPAYRSAIFFLWYEKYKSKEKKEDD